MPMAARANSSILNLVISSTNVLKYA